MAAEQRHTDTIITDVTFEEYWDTYAAQGYEWVGEGMVKMPGVHERHDELHFYLQVILRTYFKHRPIGVVRREPFVMRYDWEGKRRSRQPDLQVILNPTPDRYTETGTIGPADIALEIVSPESVDRDYQEKFEEYQGIGVREYWIIDDQRRRAEFNRLNTAGRYDVLALREGSYETPLLPDLRFLVEAFWQDPLPDHEEAGAMVRQQLGIDR